VITISSRPVGRNWSTISFASTLYLSSILDLLLAEVPCRLQAELRLGLQEALVNAAKHGNKLDPSKIIIVRFAYAGDRYWWIISDQGCGFDRPCECNPDPEAYLPPVESENGRGTCILYKIFDRVIWNAAGTELRLGKQVSSRFRLPLLN